MWKAARKKQPFSLLELAASYVHGKPKQTTEHSGTVTFRLVDESKRHE